MIYYFFYFKIFLIYNIIYNIINLKKIIIIIKIKVLKFNLAKFEVKFKNINNKTYCKIIINFLYFLFFLINLKSLIKFLDTFFQ